MIIFELRDRPSGDPAGSAARHLRTRAPAPAAMARGEISRALPWPSSLISWNPFLQFGGIVDGRVNEGVPRVDDDGSPHVVDRAMGSDDDCAVVRRGAIGERDGAAERGRRRLERGGR